jgi:transposase-like protein
VRLHLILPHVRPDTLVPPERCPYPQCSSTHFRHHQTVVKSLIDTHYTQVGAQRYRCLGCGRTFRVYPQGVDGHSFSQRTRGLGVMLYLLGLSYGATSLALGALDVYQAKSTVYAAVQAAAERVPGLGREALLTGVRTPALGADVTGVKCGGKWLPLGLMVDDVHGTVLSIDELTAEDAETLADWVAPVAEAVGAELLITDDADSFKQVADALDLPQQVCISHVQRNTEALVAELLEAVAAETDDSLGAIGVDVVQAQADLCRLREVVRARRPEDEAELEALHQHYVQAAAPAQGERATLAYRVRMLTLDRWELWRRLTRYRTWQGAGGERIDGTNNGCERAIGWWIKERYRPMRGYKRTQSALNVSRLIAFCGNRLESGGVDLTTLIA